MNTQLSASDILAGLEAYMDELPGADPSAVSIHCELTHEQQVTLILDLWALGRARTEDERGTICRKIWTMVGLSCDLPSYEEAAGRAYADAMARRQGGAK